MTNASFKLFASSHKILNTVALAFAEKLAFKKKIQKS